MMGGHYFRTVRQWHPLGGTNIRIVKVAGKLFVGCVAMRKNDISPTTSMTQGTKMAGVHDGDGYSPTILALILDCSLSPEQNIPVVKWLKKAIMDHSP